MLYSCSSHALYIDNMMLACLCIYKIIVTWAFVRKQAIKAGVDWFFLASCEDSREAVSISSLSFLLTAAPRHPPVSTLLETSRTIYSNSWQWIPVMIDKWCPQSNCLSWNYIETRTRRAFPAVVNNRGASPHAFTAAKSYTRYDSFSWFYVWSRKAPN